MSAQNVEFQAAADSQMRGTKIVATLGPATADVGSLRTLLDAGVNVVRLNFSHGTREAHEQTLEAVRAAAAGRSAAVAVLGDLCGPKIRLGELAGGAVDIAPGDGLEIVAEQCVGDARRVSINHPEILDDIAAGHQVLIDDGMIRLRVTGCGTGVLRCTCEVGGTLRNHKGVNLPDSDVRLGALTDKDFDDARWAIASGLDYLGLSFVRKAEDVHRLRQFIAGESSEIQIISKIETPQAVADLENVIEASDGVLVARGDLGVEMDVAHVPRVQKRIIDRCRSAGKPVIVATQMLQSMIEAPFPTRAEVSDVANAIVDGADAVMLSGETAVGKHPCKAVNVLHRVAVDTEYYDQERLSATPANAQRPGVAAAVAASMKLICDDLKARAAAVWTEQGELACLLSKQRLDLPVVALTPSDAVRRRMALYYGVVPVVADRQDDARERIATLDRVMLEGGWAAPGELVVAGFGPRGLGHEETGLVYIHRVAAADLP